MSASADRSTVPPDVAELAEMIELARERYKSLDVEGRRLFLCLLQHEFTSEQLKDIANLVRLPLDQ